MFLHTVDENNILYVILDGDKCRKNNHLLSPTQVNVKLVNGETLVLSGQYCCTCNQVQISRNLYAQNSEYHSLILAKLFLKGIDDADLDDKTNYQDYIVYERAVESKLKKYHYSVSQNSRLTNSERQDLLRRLIGLGEVEKGYVISYLQHLIQINGKKESNSIALKKWKSDLNYVLNL